MPVPFIAAPALKPARHLSPISKQLREAVQVHLEPLRCALVRPVGPIRLNADLDVGVRDVCGNRVDLRRDEVLGDDGASATEARGHVVAGRVAIRSTVRVVRRLELHELVEDFGLVVLDGAYVRQDRRVHFALFRVPPVSAFRDEHWLLLGV
jgi:hypothetical protein